MATKKKKKKKPAKKRAKKGAKRAAPKADTAHEKRLVAALNDFVRAAKHVPAKPPAKSATKR